MVGESGNAPDPFASEATVLETVCALYTTPQKNSEIQVINRMSSTKLLHLDFSSCFIQLTLYILPIAQRFLSLLKKKDKKACGCQVLTALI